MGKMPSLSLAHTGAPVAATACQGTHGSLWSSRPSSLSVQFVREPSGSLCPVCLSSLTINLSGNRRKPVSSLSVQSVHPAVREPSGSLCPVCPYSLSVQSVNVSGNCLKPVSSLSVQSVHPICQGTVWKPICTVTLLCFT